MASTDAAQVAGGGGKANPGGSGRRQWCCSVPAAVVYAAVAVFCAWIFNTKAPHITHRGSAQENHPYHVFNPIWTESEVDNLLRNVVRAEPLQPTTVAYSAAQYDNVGEKVPTNDEGGCDSPYLTPTKDHTACIFPERVDVARHQMISGGIDALKESYNTSVSRLLIMQRYYHAAEGHVGDDVPEVAALFRSERYLQHAAAICPGRKHLVPMTLALIIALPGQMVAMHYDLPWFTNADRYTFPGWLLAVMQTSGLFAETRIPQVQGVAYLHRWGAREAEARRGGFYFYANGTGAEPQVAPAAHNTAIICDGTEMVHGTQTYMREVARTPVAKDGASYSLAYTGGEGDDATWLLTRDGQPLREYKESELRITLVWRQHCFRDADEHAAWERGDTSRLTLEQVLSRLEADLVQRGVVAAADGLPRHNPRAVMELLVEHYIRYPYPTVSAFPYNVCALDALLPSWLGSILSRLCP